MFTVVVVLGSGANIPCTLLYLKTLHFTCNHLVLSEPQRVLILLVI